MVSADYSIYIGHYNFPLQVTMKAIAIVAILVSLMISVPACKLIPAYYPTSGMQNIMGRA